MDAEHMLTDSARLHSRVRTEIARMGPAPEAFDELALAIATYQVAHVAPLARLCRARAIDVTTLDGIDALPAIPCDVLRLARVAAHPPSLDVRVFRTSGTTMGARGEHCFRDLATYEAAAIAFGARMLWRDRRIEGVIALTPSETEVPDSSLGFMVDLFARHLVAPVVRAFTALHGLDVEALRKGVENAPGPLLVAGAAFAYVALLDDTDQRPIALPEGSVVMLTGGFKGRSREVPEAELRTLLGDRFAVPPDAIIGEYGMTELSSQLYEARGPNAVARYRAPPWVRVSAVDPVSLTPVPLGEVGLCRIVDLANVDSAVAIQTSDRIRIDPEGIALLGRMPGATPRGCSLAVEEILERA